MTTLINRATPQQARIFNIVRGATINAFHAHPGWDAERLAGSIAKRATGTITAQWRDVLATVSQSSDKLTDATRTVGRRAGKHGFTCPPGERLIRKRRSPLQQLWKNLSAQIRPLKEAGETARAEAYVEVLKMIAALQREDTP